MIEVRCNSKALLCYFTINQSSSKAFFIAESAPNLWTLQALEGTTVIYVKITCGTGESYFPFIPLNEIQTMFSQIALASVPLTKKPEDTVYQIVNGFERGKKTRGSKAGRSRYFILAARKFFYFMSLFRQWFSFSFEQCNFRVQRLEYTAYSKRCV